MPTDKIIRIEPPEAETPGIIPDITDKGGSLSLAETYLIIKPLGKLRSTNTLSDKAF